MATVRSTVARLRNHVVTGFIFLMPVLVSLAVILRFWNHLLRIGGKFSRLLRVDTVLGPSGDAVMAVAFFLVICVIAGYLVRFSFLRRVSDRVDRQLDSFFPGYRQLRSETRRKIGVDKEEVPSFDACLVKVQELWEPGYVVERNPDGMLTVFVPQAPATTQGQVYVAQPDQVRMLGVDSAELDARLKKLGKDIHAFNLRAPANVH